jgi:anaerobic magnesium-protoporphyrin IX monomethyl ester cyclase
MARALLVNPPFYRLLQSRYNANSLGIAYVASVLNQNGHDAWLYNADFVDEREFINLKAIFTKFDDYKKYFDDENDPLWEEIVSNIIEFIDLKPEEQNWVGFTSYTANLTSIKILSKKLRERRPNVKQIIGGPHSTMDKNILDKIPTLDYAIRREGEFAMLRLVNGEDPKKVPGVAHKNKLNFLIDNGDHPPIKPVEQLPFPERSKFWKVTDEQKKYIDVSYIVTIRGCPYDCTYCASPEHWKRDKVQYRSPENVLAELRHVKDNYWGQIKEFDYSQSNNIDKKDKLLVKDNSIVYFVDDVFTIKKDRVKKILQGMIDQNLQMPFKAEMRTDHLDPEICRLLKEAGCVRAKIGIESGSPKIIEQISKRETREEMLHGCKLLEAADVPYTIYLMTGFPGETDDDLRQTISFAREVKASYYSLGILSPYFGTQIYNDLLKEGHPLDKYPDHYFYHQSPELLVNTTITKPVLDEYLSLNELNKGKGYV